MDEIDIEVDKIEKQIMGLACKTPEGCDHVIWPMGVSAPYKPNSRHEVIRWDYFNSTHIFLGNDFESVEDLKEHYREDIDETLRLAMKYLNSQKRSNKYEFKRLLNGYKQFDPTRGASYTFDLVVYDTRIGRNVHKRVDVMRPFGNIEIIPMPYVTESTRVCFVVPVSIETDFNQMRAFFWNYEKSILSVKDAAANLNLIVVYLTSSFDDFK